MPVVALGPLAAVLIALMVLLLAYAALELGKFLAQLFSHVPVIGGWVGSHLVGVTDSASRWVWAKFWGAATTAAGWLHTAYLWIKVSTDAVEALGSAAADTMWHIATVQIPREVGALRSWASDQVNAARTYAGHLVGAAVADLVNRIAVTRTYAHDVAVTVRTELLSAVASARADLRNLAYAVEAEALAAVAAAEAKAAGLFNLAEHDAAAAVAAARADLAASVAAAEAQAAAAVKAAEAEAVALSQAAVHDAGVITDLVGVKALEALWGDLTDAAGAVAGELTPELAGLEDLLKGLEGASLTGLAGALSALGVLSLTQVQALEKCILPNCRNLSGLGQFLSGLLGAAEDAALLALIVGLATDPAGTARVIDDVAGPVVSGTVTGIRDLVGA